MFDAQAEEAMHFHATTFENSTVLNVVRTAVTRRQQS
jgi:predicted 3-demethylubiquinone-9 3-methyltransferase (glyoxalase superfamily)